MNAIFLGLKMAMNGLSVKLNT